MPDRGCKTVPYHNWPRLARVEPGSAPNITGILAPPAQTACFLSGMAVTPISNPAFRTKIAAFGMLSCALARATIQNNGFRAQTCDCA